MGKKIGTLSQSLLKNVSFLHEICFLNMAKNKNITKIVNKGEKIKVGMRAFAIISLHRRKLALQIDALVFFSSDLISQTVTK